MKRLAAPLLVVAAFTAAACQPTTMSQQDRTNLGLLAGAGAGLLTAEAFDANPQWTILAALGGAVAGTVVARNTSTGQCAYSNGDGTYRTGPC